MAGEVLMALAQWAGQTVAAAAVTDMWESARRKFARLFGRGDPRRTEAAERWLAQTHEQLTAAAGADLEPARAAQARRWEGRFADLLDEDPAWRLACGRWSRRSRRSCLPGRWLRLITRSRLGGM